MILVGPLLAGVLGGLLILAYQDDQGFSNVSVFVGFASPLVGGLMLHRHIALRIVLGVVFAICGFIVSAIAVFFAWVMAGAPGFRPGN